MSYTFALIEQGKIVDQDVEALLCRSFGVDEFTRILSKLDDNNNVICQNIVWSSYDIILIDCFVSVETGAECLRRIKWDIPNPTVLLLSDKPEVEQYALQEGVGFFKFKGSWGSLCAKVDVLIGLKNHLLDYPFQHHDWRLLELLHNGENSSVYKAVDRNGKLVAIKRYKYNLTNLSDASREEFLSDLKQFSNLETPRLVRIYDSGIINGSIYQVMELMEQGSLRDNLNAHQRLPLPHALTWFFEIVYALHVVHEAGLIHRDLKTANIMLRDDGSLALNDYGTATNLLVEAGFIREDEIYCTPYYVSPERALDEPSGVTSDIYSLGIIFYELLMGDKPYHGSTEMELMMQHVLAPIPTFPPEYEGYQSLLDKMLAKDETQRLQRVIDVGSYLSG
ncbi:MAG TPA: serine/threonine protein kinase [Leucothrix mucor]|nr:serine/threonine protein kinase [Leucothrix mucor]